MNNNSIFLAHQESQQIMASGGLDLLISVTPSSLSYLIKNASSDQIIALFDSQMALDPMGLLEEELQHREALKEDFGKVKVCIASGSSILVPGAFSSDAGKWGSAYLSQGGKTSVRTAELSNGITAVIELPDQLHRILSDAGISNTSFYHPVAAILEAGNSDGLYINFTSDHAYFAWKNAGQLVFQNLFELATADEFNYFILLLQDQLSIPEDTPVYLSGLINEDDELYQRVSKYFHTVQFHRSENIHLADLLANRLPAHYFTHITGLASCA